MRGRSVVVVLVCVAALLCGPAKGRVDYEDVRGFVEDPVFAFEDVAEEAGVWYVQMTPLEEGECPIPVTSNFSCGTAEKMSGGATVGDVDGDGWDDLFVTRFDANDILYKNNGDGTFTDITESANLSGYDDFMSNGAGFADLDSDGDLDLIVLSFGSTGHKAFINDGSGVFSEEAEERGLDLTELLPSEDVTPIVALLGTTVSFGDFDGDSFVDVYVGEWRLPYVHLDVDGKEILYGDGCSRNVVNDCGPQNNRLLRNRGSEGMPGYFEDVTVISGVMNFESAVFAAAFVDLDQDGDVDISTSADWGSWTSRMWWNNGDSTFTNGVSAIDDSVLGNEESGMGLTFGDIDWDGDLDRYATGICRTPDDEQFTCTSDTEGNRFNRNDLDTKTNNFVEMAAEWGVEDGGWGWGAALADFDNDADLDLITTNGVQVPSMPPDDYEHDRTRYFNHIWPLQFDEVATHVGVNDTREGKGLVVFDYDKDGDLDVFIVNTASTPILYRSNASEMFPNNKWLRIRFAPPVGTQCGACIFEGLNAKITVIVGDNSYFHEMGVSTHFYGQSERVAHFGLGEGVDQVDTVRICFPRTGCQDLTDIPTNQELVVPAPAEEAPSFQTFSESLTNSRFTFSESESMSQSPEPVGDDDDDSTGDDDDDSTGDDDDDSTGDDDDDSTGDDDDDSTGDDDDDSTGDDDDDTTGDDDDTTGDDDDDDDDSIGAAGLPSFSPFSPFLFFVMCVVLAIH